MSTFIRFHNSTKDLVYTEDSSERVRDLLADAMRGNKYQSESDFSVQMLFEIGETLVHRPQQRSGLSTLEEIQEDATLRQMTHSVVNVRLTPNGSMRGNVFIEDIEPAKLMSDFERGVEAVRVEIEKELDRIRGTQLPQYLTLHHIRRLVQHVSGFRRDAPIAAKGVKQVSDPEAD